MVYVLLASLATYVATLFIICMYMYIHMYSVLRTLCLESNSSSDGIDIEILTL